MVSDDSGSGDTQSCSMPKHTEIICGLVCDGSSPRSSFQPRRTNTGQTTTSVLCPDKGYECMFSGGMSVCTQATTDLSHGSVNETSTVGINPRGGCAGMEPTSTISLDAQFSCSSSSGHGLDGISMRLGGILRQSVESVYDDNLGRHYTEVKRRANGDETASPPTDAMAEERLAAESHPQSPSLFRILHLTFGYYCATENLGCVELRTGWHGRILRWRKGSELSYIVCTETFPSSLALVIEDAMRKAILMWQGIGATFKQVPRDSRATFALRFEGGKCKKGYALSFMPDTEPAELLVYEKSVLKAEFLPNILAHEIGHILGLRHGFAHLAEWYNPSVSFGTEDNRSVMQYHAHPEQLKVSELDIQGLSAIYEYDQAEYGGFPVVDIGPELHDLDETSITSHAT